MATPPPAAPLPAPKGYYFLISMREEEEEKEWPMAAVSVRIFFLIFLISWNKYKSKLCIYDFQSIKRCLFSFFHSISDSKLVYFLLDSITMF